MLILISCLQQTAKGLSTQLLDANLATHISVLPETVRYYRDDNQNASVVQTMLMMTTSQSMIEEVFTFLQKKEFIPPHTSVAILGGSYHTDYANWLTQALIPQQDDGVGELQS
ncbi:MAG: hypothetical protein ACPG8W_11855 [Candidatus Promineifilaceae bacterium]